MTRFRDMRWLKFALPLSLALWTLIIGVVV